MPCNYFEVDGQVVAELTPDSVISTTQDALESMADAYYQGAEHIIWHQRNLTLEFFDLNTGLAGEVLQKFSNYRLKLIIIGNFQAFASSSLEAFITESNRGRQIAFVADKDTALAKIKQA